MLSQSPCLSLPTECIAQAPTLPSLTVVDFTPPTNPMIAPRDDASPPCDVINDANDDIIVQAVVVDKAANSLPTATVSVQSRDAIFALTSEAVDAEVRACFVGVINV